MDGVKFYSNGDLAAGHFLSKSEDLILNFMEDPKHTINDILELYNCTLYIENKIFFTQWSNEHKVKLTGSCRGIKGYIARYFSSINKTNIESLIENLHWQYKDDFLKLFAQYHLQNRIDENAFANMLSKKFFSLTQVCQQRQLVENYQTVIKNFLLKDPSNVTLLLDKYVVDSKTSKKQVDLPKSLTKDEVNMLISNYIDSPEAHPNYLQLIINNHNTKEFSVTDEHRWKAKQKKENIEEELFKNSKGIPFTYKFVLQKDASKLVEQKLDDTGLERVYNQSYLEQELDFETILNNFIWLFNFVDSNGRINFVSNTPTRTSLLDTIKLKSKKDYPANYNFKFQETVTDEIMAFYYPLLKKQNIRLEDILECFFKVYLKEDFAVSDYLFTAPSEGSSYKEKCRDILPEIEYILQQFKSYVDYKLINHEMLSLSSSGIAFSQVPSLLNNKYIYAQDILNPVFHLLFSDQTLLGYLSNPEKDSATFFELMVQHKVHIDEFEEYQRTELQYLVDNNYISIIDGFLSWKNPLRIQILCELYRNNVISMYRLDHILQAEVKLMHMENKIKFESTLLSKSEQDMFDYYLNNSKFQNGPQLRNKYAHGRLGNAVNNSEEINYINYLLILKLLIVIVIKINEDFCLYEIVNKKGL
ncbi:hypothetical protein [Bacillus cereus]|uniref:hypothetical protein n=1 Tax=Bacillus cereus TaxID=1396 RepID=UPI000BF9E4A7|nr:hypothetical protein [Bacillus cereus]PFI03170.1 hypothetical protein COI64_07440 [Bacillus cereus]PFR27342.1 hypothetical protein COK22_19445 [Bacillus cereus]